MKNYVTIGGGLLIAISMFLSFASAGELSWSGLEFTKLAGNAWVAYFWIACGVVIAICGFMGKKSLNILGLILSLVVAGIAIKYKMDAGAAAGIGIWMMLAGGALGIIGSGMALMKKSA